MKYAIYSLFIIEKAWGKRVWKKSKNHFVGYIQNGNCQMYFDWLWHSYGMKGAIIWPPPFGPLTYAVHPHVPGYELRPGCLPLLTMLSFYLKKSCCTISISFFAWSQLVAASMAECICTKIEYTTLGPSFYFWNEMAIARRRMHLFQIWSMTQNSLDEIHRLRVIKRV